MAELDLEIVYRPGEKNVVADVLSRYGVDGVAKATASAPYHLDYRALAVALASTPYRDK